MGAVAAPATARTVLGAYNVRNYGAKGDLREVTDAVTTNGSPIVTSATAAFTQADVGKRIYVCDALGGIVRLNSTIASVQSATQATAVGNANATLTGRTMRVATDDTAAIQAAINASANGAPVILEADRRYKITSTLTTKKLTCFRGAATGYPGDIFGTEIDALDLTSTPAIAVAANARNVVIENLYLLGPSNGAANPSAGIVATAAINLTIRNCYLRSFYRGVDIQNAQQVYLDTVWGTNALQNGLRLLASSNVTVVGCVFANAANTGADTANILVDSACTDLAFYLAIIDEGAPAALGGGVYFKSCTDVLFSCPRLYAGHGANGIHVGASATRVTIFGTAVIPFVADGSHVPLQTIKIAAGATDTRLVNVTTIPNGGGDISDLATDTVYINVNGKTSGLKRTVTAISVDATLTAADSGKVLRVTGVDKIATLPATVAGLRYTFVMTAAALSAGTGFSISPAAADKIMGNGITSLDDKDLINSGATDAEGDTVTLVGDGVDGWYVEVMRGTWARQA